MEVRLRDAEAARAASRDLIEKEKWVFYLSYMGRGETQIRVEGVSLEATQERLASGLLTTSEGIFDIINVHQTVTLNMWSFGPEITVMLVDGDRRYLPDEITLSDGRCSNFLVIGRLPICNKCKNRGTLRKVAPE